VVLGVVETMTDPEGGPSVFGTGGGQLLADELQVPLLGTIPLDIAVREGGDSGVPITAAGESDIATRFAQLAERVEARAPKFPKPPPAPADRIKNPLALL
ncbi:MAG: P-loop NTPase, partial [Gaiellales bacterium]